MTANVPTRLLLLVALPCGAAGCGTQAAPLHPLEPAQGSPAALGTEFDPGRVGAIRGRVTWVGAVPDSHSFRDARVAPPYTAARHDSLNPHVPRIDEASRGVAGAIVFLRWVDPSRSRPWNLAPARVAMADGTIGIMEDQSGPHVAGVVRRGDAVEMVSTTPKPEMLRARGAAFFTLAFPDAGRTLERSFDRAGVVELSSGAGNYWARAWLFVADHPYYVRTSADGTFRLDQVPDGSYELVCWMPNWRTGRFERDPESTRASRLWYGPPLEKCMSVRVERGEVTDVRYEVGAGDFTTIQMR